MTRDDDAFTYASTFPLTWLSCDSLSVMIWLNIAEERASLQLRDYLRFDNVSSCVVDDPKSS